MRSSALLVAALVLVTVAGCVPETPAIVPAPEPTATPLFASDEEALAAAEEAYAAYLAVSDQIISEGGANPDRLLAVAEVDAYELELAGYQLTASNGWRSVGRSSLDSVTLQSAVLGAGIGEIAVTVYACVDLSELDVVDSSGSSVVSNDRKDRNAFETSFAATGNVEAPLILSEKDIWSGEDFCN